MKLQLKAALLSGLTVVASSAHAQEINPAGGLPGAGSSGAMQTSPAPVTEPTTADSPEILVTAQRRSQRLRDVPIAITALTATTLEKAGVIGILDLPRVTPGLELPVLGAFVQPSIRGVSSGGGDVGDSSNVALYIDGVYQVSQSGQLLDLPDVERIEVLKGPQGTLYGQNAEGGAIIITTLSPSFTPTGKVSASYGNYNDVSLRGYVSGPISKNLAASLTASYQNRDGFRRDLIYGGRDKGLRSALVRGKLLFEPTDSASFLLTAYWARRGDSALFAGQALNNNSIGYAAFPDAPSPANAKEIALSTRPDVVSRVWGVSLKGDIDVGPGKITSVTSYSGGELNVTGDIDYSPASVGETQVNYHPKYFIQELTFVSTSLGPLTLTAGGFFLTGSESDDPQIFIQRFPITLAPAEPGPAVFNGRQVSEMKKLIVAGYAEAAYEVNDKLTVTAGARYSYERQKAFSDLFQFVPAPIASPFNPAIYKKFNPRVTVRYAIAEKSNLYASYGQGFKSGVLSSNALFSTPARPEELTAYEIGFKGEIVRGVNLNIAAFHYDYKNIQVQRFVAPTSIYENAASARIRGIDFDMSLNLLTGLNLIVGGVYLDSRYNSYPLAGVFLPSPTGGNMNATLDVTGQTLIRAPKFTGSVTANYSFDVDPGRVEMFATGYYNDGSKMEASGRIRQPSYATVDAELSFSPAAYENVRLSLWGRNLSDKVYYQGMLPTTFADGVSYAPPRTFGGRVEYKF